MQTLRYLRFALILVVVIHAGSTLSKSLVSALASQGSIITIERNEKNVCSKHSIECTSCSEGIICRPENGKLIQFAKVTCVAGSSTPYCNPDTGLCTSEAPIGCGLNKFFCPSQDGIYPDPTNCTRYYLCVSGVSVTNTCPKNNVYDHDIQQCKLQRNRNDCVTFNCAGKEGQAVVYPKDDRIWGRCVGGKALILGRCKDYEKYDVVDDKCVRVCKKTGVQPPDPPECQKYVFCAEVAANTYESIVLSCACNEGFDEKLGRCSTTAPCLSNVTSICGKSSVNVTTNSLSPYIISGSGNVWSRNISNTDEINANLVNGNNHGANINIWGKLPTYAALSIKNEKGDESSDEENDHSAEGNEESEVGPLMTNSSSNGNIVINVENGNDNTNGNVVNGNNNSENGNSGNVKTGNNGVEISPQIINNSGNGNSNNGISNGNDNVDGNLVNGNNKGRNDNSGNVNKRIGLSSYVISGSGSVISDNIDNTDKINANLVNGENHGTNINIWGNLQKKHAQLVYSALSNEDSEGNESGGIPRANPLIINNSGIGNNNNNISNGNDDVDGNLVNGNNDGHNSNSGNVNKGLHVNSLIMKEK